MSPPVDNECYLWRPRRGIDTVALARLCASFPRPHELMGEAWFMGDKRRMYDELLTRATGKPLHAEPYLNYLTQKFTEIYNLE